MEVLSTSFTLLLFRIIENVVLYVWESFKQYKMDAWRFPFHFLCLGVATWVFCRRLPLLPVLVRPFQDSLCVSLSTLGSDTNLNSINHEWERLYIHSGSVALCIFKRICQPNIWTTALHCSFNSYFLLRVRMCIISDVLNAFVFPALWTDNLMSSLLYISLLGCFLREVHVHMHIIYVARKLVLCLSAMLPMFCSYFLHFLLILLYFVVLDI